MFPILFGVFMKKLMLKILVGVFAVCMLTAGLVGCGKNNFKASTTFNNWGAGEVVGGFIGQKANYVYYINGNAQSDGDNTFGTPVKGALMAADKNDLTKTEVVVPNLFVTSDFNAGVYIYGDYVYYGTPSTDKNSKGEIAYTDLVFTKTKLDGSSTEKLFTIAGLSTEFRIVEVEGKVYIVYYDKGDEALKEYSVSDGSTKVIAAKDFKNEKDVVLDAYKFTENGDKYVVCFTGKVFTDGKYYEEKGQRDTADYNQVYAYEVGKTYADGADVLGDKICDGKDNVVNYALNYIKADKLFYTETKNEVAKNYSYSFANANHVQITNASAVSDGALVTGDNEVYIFAESKVQKTVLTGDKYAETKTVALVENVNTLLAVKDGYLYYFDTEAGISRIKLNDQTAKPEKVSEKTVTTTWYRPQFVTIGETEYLFYCDNSYQSYIKYVQITNATVIGEDTDDDGENDTFKLSGHKFIGKMTDYDSAMIVTNKITAISGKLENGVLPYEKDDNGKLFVAVVNEAQTAYNALSDGAKKNVSDDSKNLLAKYQKAIEMANLYEKLDGIREDNVDKESFRDEYESVKTQIEEFKASDDYSSVSAYIGKNRLWNYQKAVSLFAAE